MSFPTGEEKWTYPWKNVLMCAWHAKAKMTAPMLCFKNSRSRILTRLTRLENDACKALTETASVFVVNWSVAVGEILYIKVIGRDISGGHFSKLETFVVRPLMVIEDRNCAGRWYMKSVPWKRKSWIKLSDPRLQNSIHSRHWLNPWGFFSDCEATPNYYTNSLGVVAIEKSLWVALDSARQTYDLNYVYMLLLHNKDSLYEYLLWDQYN